MAGPHPQRLGSHLGARLDFTTRDGARDRLTVRGLVSGSAASTVWEGPLGIEQEGELAGGGAQELHRLAAAADRPTTDTTFGFTDGKAKLTFDLTPRQTLRVSLIAGRSVLRERTIRPGRQLARSAASTTLIGNVQWRFTPSPKFARRSRSTC